ncbi:hypothetical protein HPP92_007843 [Vanilla planifolia]|uniref:Uncharacterized protein n=1 Tax=Vanilla planifolia TaxID=51239 RepID=A0A835RBB1_VANPL|nr:hypothetical protein HPP92_008012 [Vanilla planifolia]KAG0490980.1 hypothetical protein HPP92_007843 [Vanilla planifolia]
MSCFLNGSPKSSMLTKSHSINWKSKKNYTKLFQWLWTSGYSRSSCSRIMKSNTQTNREAFVSHPSMANLSGHHVKDFKEAEESKEIKQRTNLQRHGGQRVKGS